MTEPMTSASELHLRLLEHYAPPSLLVDGNLDVVHVSESAGRYLQIAGGRPTRYLLRLAHPGIESELRAAIEAARRTGSATRSVRYEDRGRERAVDVRVLAVDVPELGSGALLVLFSDQDTQRDPSSGSTIEPVVRGMEDELHRTRDQLRAIVAQYEASLEELGASNCELHAIGEELHVATEELETSKQELQAVNEELIALNHTLKQKIDEVTRANSDLQNLMTSTEIGVIFLDRRLDVQRFTPPVCELFPIGAQDIGRPIANLTHRLALEDLSEVARSVLDTLRPVEREVRSRDGRSFLVRWLPYRSLDDRIEGVVLTFVDVTDLRDAVAARRRSEAALFQVEERLRIALVSAPIVVLALDDKSATWGFVLGRELAPEERDLSMFAPGHAARLLAASRDVIEKHRGTRMELDLVLDGAIHTFDFRLEPALGGATAVGFDITPSKQAEAALRDADRRKDEFLATLSHELRNPLTPLQVALDVARLADDDPAQREQSLSIMERQVAMLTTLVDELLDLSRVTQGKIVLERSTVNVAHVLESALLATRPLFDSAKHEIQIELPDHTVEIDGDRSRLVQVFTNLLSNAAKYTLPNGRVTVRIRPQAQSVRVDISDNGLGIAPDMLPTIFDIFVQCRDARGRSQGGLGIGLNLVRRLVELHGGMVTASSEGQGRGSTFVVELPLPGRS